MPLPKRLCPILVAGGGDGPSGGGAEDDDEPNQLGRREKTPPCGFIFACCACAAISLALMSSAMSFMVPFETAKPLRTTSGSSCCAMLNTWRTRCDEDLRARSSRWCFNVKSVRKSTWPVSSSASSVTLAPERKPLASGAYSTFSSLATMAPITRRELSGDSLILDQGMFLMISTTSLMRSRLSLARPEYNSATASSPSASAKVELMLAIAAMRGCCALAPASMLTIGVVATLSAAAECRTTRRKTPPTIGRERVWVDACEV
mmetsp:Transcript_34715/g.59517  ORF Transcript_34715/g.59517 Transcript_34715/m.59517 type:complete len:262 (+) Transcript_34715:296-1081(+)